MGALIAVGLPAGVLAAAAWLALRQRGKRSATGARTNAVRAPGLPADPAACASLARMRRDWMLPLVEMAFGRQASGITGAQRHDAIVAAGQALDGLASAPHRLPRRPQLLPQLLGTINDEASSGREIAALIRRDPTLAGNLLKLANSALYRVQAAPVESVDRAVALVGTQGLRRLVAVALMQPVMQVDGGVLGRLPELVWEHTQYAALAAEEYAHSVEGEDGFAAQLLALLQGLGLIVAVQALRDACAGREPPPAADTAALLQAWAPRIGRLMVRDWGLSDRALQAMDDQALSGPEAMGPLGRALLAAGPLGLASMQSVRSADLQEPPETPAPATAP